MDPRKIGKYEILGRIGRGAMGVVLKARDPLLDRVVAIKTISVDRDNDPETHTRFLREARAAGHLSHPSIITIYELGEEGGRAYMVMEFLEGHDLKTLLQSRAPMPLEEKLRIICDVARGIAHAHEHQVIHRDIKPANVFLTELGEVKILDFGLARAASSKITRTGQVMGTPSYMSPEQVRGQRVDHRSDVFSLGALFYELASGRKPFDGQSISETFYKILHQEPAPLESVAPELPHDLLSPLLKRALAKDPQARYQRVRELVSDLERLQRSLESRRSEKLEKLTQIFQQLGRLVENNRELLELEAEGEEADLKSLLSRIGAGLASPPWESASDYLAIGSLLETASRDLGLLRTILRAAKDARTLLRKAERLEEEGDLEQARRVTHDLLRRFPGNRRAANLEQRIASRSAKTPPAGRTAAEPPEGATPEDLFQEALRRSEEDDLGGCLKLLTRLLRIEPDHFPACALLEHVRAEIMQRALVQESEPEADRAASPKAPHPE
jgi:serine/threonine-protein kinase